MSNNQLTTIDKTAGEYLQKFGKALETYAIREYDKTLFLKSAMLAITSNENLAACLNTEQGKLSIFNALRYAAVTGLSLNPQEQKACLIAYNGQVSYQIMKAGMIELSLKSGMVENIISDHICANDEFKLIKTSDGDKYEFIPALKGRRAIEGFFAAIKFKNGKSFVKYMTKSEVEEIRDKYSKFYRNKEGKVIPDSPWNKSFAAMGEKTVIKKMLRSIATDISEKFEEEIMSDDFYEVDFTVDPGISADQVNEKLKAKTEKKAEKKPQPEPKQENVSQGDLL